MDIDTQEDTKALTTSLVQQIIDKNDSFSDDLKLEECELELRRTLLSKVAASLQDSSSLPELGGFWIELLDTVVHQSSNESNQRKAPALRRQLPILLLDEIVDLLPTEHCLFIWERYVEVSYHKLFGKELWCPVLPAKSHVSWLPFLKVANKLLRRLSSQPAARLMHAMAREFPLSEKSATKAWGSHNTENIIEWESKQFFESQHSEPNRSSEDGSVPDYRFYESFWKLQQDFHRPYQISVADFLHRVRVFFAALEGHKPKASSETPSFGKYQTNSRLLSLQLQNVDFRVQVLTQYLAMSHHMASQITSLTARLREFDDRAKRLLQDMAPRGPTHLRMTETLLEFMEPKWRSWKRKKCIPDLDGAKNDMIAFKRLKQCLLREEHSDDDHDVIDLSRNLPELACQMKRHQPATDTYLGDYVEALDPESGIECEYHPRNDSLFTWRALRLLSTNYVGQGFEQVQPNGDFEPLVRRVYREEFDIIIPGECSSFHPEGSSSDDEDDKCLVQRHHVGRHEQEGDEGRQFDTKHLSSSPHIQYEGRCDDGNVRLDNGVENSNDCVLYVEALATAPSEAQQSSEETGNGKIETEKLTEICAPVEQDFERMDNFDANVGTLEEASPAGVGSKETGRSKARSPLSNVPSDPAVSPSLGCSPSPTFANVVDSARETDQSVLEDRAARDHNHQIQYPVGSGIRHSTRGNENDKLRNEESSRTGREGHRFPDTSSHSGRRDVPDTRMAITDAGRREGSSFRALEHDSQGQRRGISTGKNDDRGYSRPLSERREIITDDRRDGPRSAHPQFDRRGESSNALQHRSVDADVDWRNRRGNFRDDRRGGGDRRDDRRGGRGVDRRGGY